MMVLWSNTFLHIYIMSPKFLAHMPSMGGKPMGHHMIWYMHICIWHQRRPQTVGDFYYWCLQMNGILEIVYWRWNIGDLEIFGHWILKIFWYWISDIEDWILEIWKYLEIGYWRYRKCGDLDIRDSEICQKYTFSLCNLYNFQWWMPKMYIFLMKY